MRIPLGFTRTIAVLFATAAVAAGTIASTTTAANAAGTSPKYLGCYAQWWSTAFAAKCDGATERHHFWLNGDCVAELDIEAGPFTVSQGFAGTVASRECTFEVRRAWLSYN
ncbi:hypothetical protein [Thermostaphylospora chromogena]|jgi:hypothetical protein|uniref:Uncharacterized protein n=1 Tax=Thermostaphylospora chromogena TaxID=35622 RepID=A0A1H1BF81_9ACTN|nr:hypothetical protein [Thermostaphylospora chromogena]SDQ50664.1 hypothetical protein SAMN04489764_0943 [Thermostaphylospora chromogena]